MCYNNTSSGIYICQWWVMADLMYGDVWDEVRWVSRTYGISDLHTTCQNLPGVISWLPPLASLQCTYIKTDHWSQSCLHSITFTTKLHVYGTCKFTTQLPNEVTKRSTVNTLQLNNYINVCIHLHWVVSRVHYVVHHVISILHSLLQGGSEHTYTDSQNGTKQC